MGKISAALISAITRGNTAYVMDLCKGDNTNWMTDANSKGKCAIHYACQEGRLEIVELLLTKNPSLLNVTDQFNHTPMLYAAVSKHHNVVVYLADKGADLNAAKNEPTHELHGYAPIHYAVFFGYRDLVEYLINRFSNINLHVADTKLDVLHIACKKGWFKIAEFLLVKRPEALNIEDNYHQTPVLFAARYGHIDLVRHLVKSGADITIPAKYGDRDTQRDGYLPMHWAIENDYHEIVQYLIEQHTQRDPNMQLDAIRLGPRKYHVLHMKAPLKIDK